MNCHNCHGPITGRRKGALYCSDACSSAKRQADFRARRKQNKEAVDLFALVAEKARSALDSLQNKETA